jgi:hypothetical protein
MSVMAHQFAAALASGAMPAIFTARCASVRSMPSSRTAALIPLG